MDGTEVVMEEKLYLRLYHGRLDAGAEMEGWGSEGPVFGPLAYVHAAYLSTMQIGFPDGERVELPVTGDLIEWDGVYYGDFEVFTRSDRDAPVRRVQRVSTRSGGGFGVRRP